MTSSSPGAVDRGRARSVSLPRGAQAKVTVDGTPQPVMD